MKEYIKPSMMVTLLNTQPIMTNSITSTNLNGVQVGGEFNGGHADSRRRRRNDWEDDWDEEEEDW